MGIDVYGVDLVFAYSHAVGVVMSFVEGLAVCFFLLRVFFFWVFVGGVGDYSVYVHALLLRWFVH